MDIQWFYKKKFVLVGEEMNILTRDILLKNIDNIIILQNGNVNVNLK